MNGQTSMFGYDNLKFKTINLPKTQRFKNLCPKFNLKQINSDNSLNLPSASGAFESFQVGLFFAMFSF